jgi:vancomycin permeability regulator SanA
MVTKNINKSTSRKAAVIILVIIINLAFLYFIKYQNQHLSLTEFSLSNFGNITNLFLSISLITGVLITIFRKSIKFDLKSFLPFFIFNQIVLLTIYISSLVLLPFNTMYYLGQTGNRLFIAFLFTLYLFSYSVTIFIIWLNIIQVKSIIILRSLFNSALLMLLILTFVFLFVLKKENGIKDSVVKNQNNIAVVLGAAVWSNNKPSPSLAGRVDKAVLLYKQNKISKIYLTGSNAPGELSESEVALKYILAKGLDKSNIILEKETTSTNEQIEYIRKKLLLNEDQNVLVISDSYHLVRVLEISKFHNIKVQVVPSDLAQSFEQALYNNLRESLALTVFWFFAI